MSHCGKDEQNSGRLVFAWQLPANCTMSSGSEQCFLLPGSGVLGGVLLQAGARMVEGETKKSLCNQVSLVFLVRQQRLTF